MVDAEQTKTLGSRSIGCGICLEPGLPAEAAAAKAGLTDHGFAAHEISLLNVGRPDPEPKNLGGFIS